MMPEKIRMFYLGYNFKITEDTFILDEELVLSDKQNNSEIKQTLPWKENDRFELAICDGLTVFKKIKE